MKEQFKEPAGAIRRLFGLFTALCAIAAIVCMIDSGTGLQELLANLVQLCTQPAQLTKSFFDASYGGFAATFLNVFLICLICSLLYTLPGAKPDGLSVLAFFLTAGFSFWGITLLNVWFLFAGVALYSLVKKKPLGSLVNAMLFATGLCPLATDLLLRYPGAELHGVTFGSFVLTLVVCACVGFILPAGLAHSPNVHKGYCLYSAALPMGLTAFFLRALLYKVLGAALPEAAGVGTGDSFPALCYTFCAVVFLLAIAMGLWLGGGKKYALLLKDTGFGVDYGAKYGPETAILNFGVYGLFIVLYYTLIGANWNAVTLGCVFCMVCCCFKGSHPANVWSIMVGYVAASFAAKGLCAMMGTEFSLAINAQAIVVGLCFANGLSPISGRYGWLAGILAGMAHYTLVTCVPLLHGGYLLYNGGFTGCILACLFVPVLEHFCKTKEERAQLKA